MKQLIHTHGAYFTVGLKDRAFVVCGVSNRLSELTPPPKTTPIAPTEATPAEQSGSEKEVFETPKEPQEFEKEVQAVAIIRDEKDSIIWCAVARGDKTLAIYKLEPAAEEGDDDVVKNVEIEATIIHITPKRVSCLAFATMPSDSGKNTIIILAGDLAGDTYAYSLQEKRRRLMLGHTASMLTGVCVLRNRILTSDRDEKIRLSSFPDSHVIEGFLLGHEAYITSIDVVVDDAKEALVASCGADGTVRLWNLETFQQVTELSVNTSDSDDKEKASTLIPTDIAIDPKGNYIAVIFDQSNRVDLFRVEDGEDKSKTLSLIKSTECPCQPLGVTFQNHETLMVLLRDPEYIIAYKVEPCESLLATMQAIEALREAATKQKIVMPETILEKDKYGHPKLRRLEETRGPSAPDAPWNRVERIEIAKNREKRAKKRRQEK